MSSAAHKIGIVTTSRADFSIYLPVLRALQADPDFNVSLIVTGMHMSENFGCTVKQVRESGYKIAGEFECLGSDDSAQAITEYMGAATKGMGDILSHHHFDLLIILGDRYEMAACAMAAVPFGVPLFHLHGGEETEGAMDNVLRHMMTKLSHLHGCATARAKTRIIQMGEPEERVIQCGAPALDAILSTPRISQTDLAEQFDVPAEGDFALITYHPQTLNLKASDNGFDALCAALDSTGMPAVFTAANADTAGQKLNAKIKSYVSSRKNMHFVAHFGGKGYYSAMDAASVMIGNSSSGILEAASLGLPVVNIGDRQAGRERSPNVIDVTENTSDILSALRTSQTDKFQAMCAKKVNVYGDGQAAPRIHTFLKSHLEKGLSPVKSFRQMER